MADIIPSRLTCVDFFLIVTLNSRMAPLFSNRAACHLKLDDFYAAANDCSKVGLALWYCTLQNH